MRTRLHRPRAPFRSASTYSRSFVAGWGDMDFNSHIGYAELPSSVRNGR